MTIKNIQMGSGSLGKVKHVRVRARERGRKEGRKGWQWQRQIGAACCDKEVEPKAKIKICWSVYVPACPHLRSWLMKEEGGYRLLKWLSSTSARLQVGWRALSPGRSLEQIPRSSTSRGASWGGPGIFTDPLDSPSLEVFGAFPAGMRHQQRPRGDLDGPGRRWVSPEQLEEESGEREAWVSLLRMLPLSQAPGKQKQARSRQEMDEAKEKKYFFRRL